MEVIQNRSIQQLCHGIQQHPATVTSMGQLSRHRPTEILYAFVSYMRNALQPTVDCYRLFHSVTLHTTKSDRQRDVLNCLLKS
jgi:hypothetical protein